MPRLSNAKWEAVRLGYEVQALPFDRLAKVFHVNKSNISRRAKKEGWHKAETQLQIEERMNAIIALNGILTQTQQETALAQASMDSEVKRRLALRGVFDGGLLWNQLLSNRLFREAVESGIADLQLANLHSQITCRNKDALLGKPPQALVSIQNNIGLQENDEIIAAIRERHKKRMEG